MTAPIRASLRQLPARIDEIRESIAGLRALSELSSYVDGCLHRVDVNLAACLYSARDAIERAEIDALTPRIPTPPVRPPVLPSVKEIVAERLRAGGYAGLCNPSMECGCGITDLMCCGNPHETDCVPADVEPCDGECAWGCDAGEPHYIQRKTKP